MQYIIRFSDSIFQNWGFRSTCDYITTSLGVRKTSYISIQLFALLMGWFLTFIADWIWDPPGAALILVGMTVANAYYGFLVARARGEKWSWRKFRKTGHVIASDLLAMAILHWIITFYPYYEKGADLLFAHFAGFKFKELFVHWRQLDFKKSGLTTILGVLKLKEVQEVIDKTQGRPAPRRPRTKKPQPDAESN